MLLYECMRDNIELFLDTMDTILPFDLKRHIVNIINTKNNIAIIRKQKIRKNKLNEQIVKLFNTCYFDNNFSLYRNDRNQIVFQNISLGNNQVFLFANNNVTQPEPASEEPNNQLVPYNNIANNISNGTSQLVLNNTIHQQNNEIVLFDNNRLETLDENGQPIRRRIKLYIVYV